MSHNDIDGTGDLYDDDDCALCSDDAEAFTIKKVQPKVIIVVIVV